MNKHRSHSARTRVGPAKRLKGVSPVILDSAPAESLEVEEPQMPIAGGADRPAENESIVTLEDLGSQAVVFHEMAQKNEKEAAVNAWESGTRLNQANSRIFAVDGYGGWGTYLQENCSTLSRTTVWRYRKIATCFTLEQV